MKTEAEARKCWCPFARNVQIGGASEPYQFSQPFNRLSTDNGKSCDGFNDNPEAARCIASDCMAWRWNEAAAKAEIPEHGYVSHTTTIVDPAIGYCGLAGTP